MWSPLVPQVRSAGPFYFLQRLRSVYSHLGSSFTSSEHANQLNRHSLWFDSFHSIPKSQIKERRQETVFTVFAEGIISNLRIIFINGHDQKVYFSKVLITSGSIPGPIDIKVWRWKVVFYPSGTVKTDCTIKSCIWRPLTAWTNRSPRGK